MRASGRGAACVSWVEYICCDKTYWPQGADSILSVRFVDVGSVRSTNGTVPSSDLLLHWYPALVNGHWT